MYVVIMALHSPGYHYIPTAGIVGGSSLQQNHHQLGWVMSLPQSSLHNEGCHHLQKEAAAGAGEPDRVLCPLPAGPLQTEEAGEAD